jgi:hypothetical protein
MAITAGVYYVGPSEPLANWSAAAAEIAGQTLTGDVTFKQRGNITETSPLTWGAGTVIGPWRLLLTSDSPNYGDVNNGYSFTANLATASSVWAFSNSASVTTGYVEISHLYFRKSNNPGWSYAINHSFSKSLVVHDCIGVEPNGGGSVFVLITLQGNLVMYNVKTYGFNFASVATNISGIGTIFKVENVSGYNVNGNFIDCINGAPTSTANRFVRNCVGYNTGVGSPVFNCGAITQANNVSSDSSASGTSPQINKPSSMWVSVEPSSSNFLKITNSSILANSGGIPLILENIFGIGGNPRPHPSLYSIGAEEALVMTTEAGGGESRSSNLLNSSTNPAVTQLVSSSNLTDHSPNREFYSSPASTNTSRVNKLPASSSDSSLKFNSSWTAIFEDDDVPYTTFSQPQPLEIAQIGLNFNKEIFVSANQVSDTPATNLEAVIYKAAKPSGGFTYDFRSSDILKVLMAHYQLGTAAATSSPFKYHFYPKKNPLTWETTGTFCKGTYGRANGRPYSVSVLKKVIDTSSAYGGTNAVFYKHGICDKLSFSLQTGDDAKASASFKFRDLDYGTAVSANPNSSEVGSYATTPSFVSTGASVTIAGTSVDISSFQLESSQAAQEFTRVGRQAPENYNFSSYSARGVFTFDLPLDAMKEVGSMFGSQTFSFLATVANSTSDRVIFDMPNCRRLPFDFNAQSGDASVKGQIPFEAFETNGTYPMRVTVDTTYSFSALLT